MGRVILAAVVGAVVVFVWGFLAWPTLKLYDVAFPKMTNQAELVETMKDSLPGTGAYFFPTPEESPDMTDAQKQAATDAWEQQHKTGPVGLLLYRAEGTAPMEPMVFVQGFALYFIISLLLAMLIAANKVGSFASRFVFVMCIAAVAALMCHGKAWNWFHLPDKYSLAMAIDELVSWTLAGLFIAGIVKVKRPAA